MLQSCSNPSKQYHSSFTWELYDILTLNCSAIFDSEQNNVAYMYYSILNILFVLLQILLVESVGKNKCRQNQLTNKNVKTWSSQKPVI